MVVKLTYEFQIGSLELWPHNDARVSAEFHPLSSHGVLQKLQERHISANHIQFGNERLKLAAT
jgi:hypothetical protein